MGCLRPIDSFVEPCTAPNGGVFLDLTGCGPMDGLWRRLQGELGPFAGAWPGNKMVARIAYKCGNKKVPDVMRGLF